MSLRITSSTAVKGPLSPRHSEWCSLDATRPSLRRLTQRASESVDALSDTASDSGKRRSLDELRRFAVGSVKGKERESDDIPRPANEREIIIHQIEKKDTLAGIALMYGCSVQSLRSANRLWPSDPIYLRKELVIPLEACHLPPSKDVFEKIHVDGDQIHFWMRIPSTEDDALVDITSQASSLPSPDAVFTPNTLEETNPWSSASSEDHLAVPDTGQPPDFPSLSPFASPSASPVKSSSPLPRRHLQRLTSRTVQIQRVPFTNGSAQLKKDKLVHIDESLVSPSTSPTNVELSPSKLRHRSPRPSILPNTAGKVFSDSAVPTFRQPPSIKVNGGGSTMVPTIKLPPSTSSLFSSFWSGKWDFDEEMKMAEDFISGRQNRKSSR